MDITKIAQEVFEKEADAIKGLGAQLDDDFAEAATAIQRSNGKLIISGMGKSGLIGKKIAATLASTGTPSFFMHPGEAYHGDLGMIEPEDILLLISYSGETDEVLRLMPFLKEQGNQIIAMSGHPDSTLARNSHWHLNIAVSEEACPLHLAPTSSTTATLVMGDALAVVLMRLNAFEAAHFAKFHPGGTLGRRLLTRAKDVMHTDNLPLCTPQSHIKEVVSRIGEGKLGIVVVKDAHGISGVITDGDIRRAMDNYEDRFFTLRAADLLTTEPKSVTPETKLTEVSDIMTSHKINTLLVRTVEGELEGIIQMYDLGI